MFLPAWTVWQIQNVDRMKLSWRPWEKVQGLKEHTQKRINHHLISKGHPQMFQSEGALCFTTPKAEHYVSGWKQVLKMLGGWLDIQVWRKWNRKLYNNKKKHLKQKWQGHKKEPTALSFPPFGRDSYSCTINHLSFRLYSYLCCCLRLFCRVLRWFFLLWRCTGHCSAMLKCPLLFSNQVAGLYFKLLCMPRSRF